MIINTTNQYLGRWWYYFRYCEWWWLLDSRCLKNNYQYLSSHKWNLKQLIRISVTLTWECHYHTNRFSASVRRWGTIPLFLSWHASIVLTVIKSTVKSLAIVRSSCIMSVSVYPISYGKHSSHRVFSLELSISCYKLQYKLIILSK